MTKDEALKLALEALEDLGMKHYESTGEVLYKETFAAIKEALAQPEQEQRNVTEQEHDVLMNSIKASSTVVSKGFLAQPEQEPVAWMRQDGQRVTTASDRHNYPDYETRYSIPLYITPPQRKPLTDEEIGAILEGVNAYGTRLYTFARAIEAAHGIKGEA